MLRLSRLSVLLPLAVLLVSLPLFISCEKETPDPPVVETHSPEELSHESALAGGEVTDDGGGSIRARGVVWSTDSLPTLDLHEGKTEEGGGMGSFSSLMTGLDPETTYYFRAYATNAGATTYGESLTFTTLIHPETVRLEGKVVYEHTMIPVEGVLVSAGSQEMTTGADGHYLFEGLPTGELSLTAEKAGYDLFSHTLTIDYGATTHNIPMRSDQYTHKLYGQVTSVPFGEPLAHVTVVLLNPDGSESNLLAAGSAEGDYELERVPRGDMVVRFKVSDYAHLNEAVHVGSADLQLDVQMHYLWPIVETGEITDTYASIAFGGGEVTYGGAAPTIGRGLVWSLDSFPEYPIDMHTMDGSGAGAFDTRLFSLMPESTIFVAAYAINMHGISYGEIIAFPTGRDEGRSCPEAETVVDPRDGTVYHTVQIGNQCWLRENMSFLPEVHNPINQSVTEARYYVYDYYADDVEAARQEDHYANYGALYNWTAAQGACPPGWRLPDNTEWGQLISYVHGSYGDFMESTAAVPLKSCRQLDSPLGGDCDTSEHPRWDDHPHFYGTDEFGLSTLPGGRRHTGGYFIDLGQGGFWWTATPTDANNGRRRSMHSYLDFVGGFRYSKTHGYSVRCIIDQ